MREAGFGGRVPLGGHRFEEEEEDEGQRADKASPIEQDLLKARTILVSGTVDDKLCASLVARALVLEDRDADAPVTVYVNSPGGSADSGFAMYDILKFVHCPVRTVVNGLCASAAVLVFLGGDEGSRLALPSSRFLIHQPSTSGQGTASDLHITSQQIVSMRERYNEIVAQACGKKPEDILADASRDFWLSTVQALEYGLVDRVIDARAEVDPS